MTRAFQLRSRPWYRKNPPEKNPAYLAFIRKLPCSVCCKTWGIEAAHFGGRGLGQKSSDLQTLPLCRKCHRTGPESYHTLGPRRFAEVHQIDPEKLIAKLNSFWDEKLKGRAA
jgi:hypothetical protein